MSIDNVHCCITNPKSWGGNYSKPEVLTNLIQVANYKYVNI